MVSWSGYVDYEYVIIDDSLVIMTRHGLEFMVRPPAGKQNEHVLRDVLQFAQHEGSEKALVLIDECTKTWISSIIPGLIYAEDRDFCDYVYRSSDLATLSGTNYAKIRNRLNKFQKQNTYSVESIAEQNMSEIREFLKRWCLWKDCEKDPLLENERKALVFSMDHFFDLDLSGLLLRVNGAVEALSVFQPMNADTIVVHYEKGSPDYDGIYKAINMETAKRVQDKYPYMNRETDMGQPGLRKAKLSYHPDHLVSMFYVTKEHLVQHPRS